MILVMIMFMWVSISFLSKIALCTHLLAPPFTFLHLKQFVKIEVSSFPTTTGEERSSSSLAIDPLLAITTAGSQWLQSPGTTWTAHTKYRT